jgi:hypothetical protein
VNCGAGYGIAKDYGGQWHSSENRLIYRIAGNCYLSIILAHVIEHGVEVDFLLRGLSVFMHDLSVHEAWFLGDCYAVHALIR